MLMALQSLAQTRKDMKDRYVRFDWAIKRLLRQKANFGVLEGFLTVFLGEKVTIVDILESEGNQQEMANPYVVDIKAKKADGELIIAEIKYLYEVLYHERMLYGNEQCKDTFALLSSDGISSVYSFNILDFGVGLGNDFLYKGQNRFKGIHTADELEMTTKQRDAIIAKFPVEMSPAHYLIRLNHFDKVPVSPMEEWMDYLRTGIINAEAKAPGLQEAREKLLYYRMEETERHAYDEHLNVVMIQHDVLRNARAEGRAEGIRQKTTERIARNMLALGMAKEQIAQVTGLDIAQVDAL